VLATAASIKSWLQAAKPDTDDSAADVADIPHGKIYTQPVQCVMLETGIKHQL